VFVVYVREAHPRDGDRPDPESNVATPRTLEERARVAATCSVELELGDLPLLIDGLDDAVERAYAAWPDRLYLIDAEGNVAYRGEPGPRGFRPDDLEAALSRLLDPR
jgi:hypothetical protein